MTNGRSDRVSLPKAGLGDGAGSIHTARATVRPVATTTTAGTANPLLSLGEEATSGLLTALAFIAPVVAFALLVALAAGLFLAWRRVRRAIGRG